MKKIIFVLTLLLLVSPALAKVEISCTADDQGVVSVYYAMSTGDTNLPRAFGLDIELSNDANIVSVDDTNPDFWVHPGSIDINTDVSPPVVDSNGSAILSDTKYPDEALEGPPDGNGMSIEMGSLYLMADGNQTPEPSGLLLTFTVDADCNVAISGNTALGKVVLENTNEDNTDYGSGCTVEFPPGYCGGDSDDDLDLDLDDYNTMKGKLAYAKYLTDTYLVVKDDPTTGFLYDVRCDMPPADDDIDLDDYNGLKGKLAYAKYLTGQYLVVKGDPITGFLWPCP